MQLGARQLQQVSQILQALDELPPHPDENRRQRARVKLQTTLVASLLEATSLPEIRIFTRNISTIGLGFLCQRPFHREELIAVHLALGLPLDKLLLGRIVFCRYVRAGMYESGVRFEEAIGYETPVRVPLTWVRKANPHAVRAEAAFPRRP